MPVHAGEYRAAVIEDGDVVFNSARTEEGFRAI
jgi:hypothetical protein